jgi:hypothetical protein
MKKDIIIHFCSKCSWKAINPEERDWTNYCPKCNGWVWEISQCYYYDNKGKELGREFSLGDNDEVFFSSYDFKEAKKMIDKAFKLFKKELENKK